MTINSKPNTLPKLWKKALIILLLIVGLQIPLAIIESLITERNASKISAEQDIAGSSGHAQTIYGPILNIPIKQQSENREITYFLFPDSLKVVGTTEIEKRYRGIFQVPTYVAKLHFEGQFSDTALVEAGFTPESIKWDGVTFSVPLVDPHTIREAAPLHWNEKGLEFKPKATSPFSNTGIHAKLSAGGFTPGNSHKFSFDITVSGTSSLSFIPLSNQTDVQLTSPWKDPSFFGQYPPTTKEVTAAGFKASWQVSQLGRDVNQLANNIGDLPNFSSMSFGVVFITPVDIYRMSDRAVKYANLVILLTFITYFLFETLGGMRLHEMQYLMVGAALILFYLLLLSLSEHLPFSSAYLCGALLAIGLITGYSISILRSGMGSALVGVLLGVQYGFFYILLQEQDYSLLFGSLGLTFILGTLMYVTRKVDWFSLGTSLKPTSEQLDVVQ